MTNVNLNDHQMGVNYCCNFNRLWHICDR